MSGMFVNGMWSTEELTRWQQYKLRLARWSSTTTWAIGMIIVGVLVRVAVIVVLGASVLDHQLYAVLALLLLSVWLVIWWRAVTYATNCRINRSRLITEGRLFSADHALMRMLWPVVQGVWRANPRSREDIGQLINESAATWYQQERQFGSWWHVSRDEECQKAWQLLECDITERLSELCPPARLVSSRIATVHHQDIVRRREELDVLIPKFEKSIAGMTTKLGDLQRALMSLSAERASLSG